ncbi:SPFH domain-containing protein [Streptomyces sp. NPDC047981]|uniref:SPFH domain-containing protein n=1 Tax=Streptomyces sp. NPDC047981 TaxID=3154610 RepID=UPI0034120B4B
MTATTPNPDSGAAASRDAARTARRLSTEPRAPRPAGHPPEPGTEHPEGASAEREAGQARVGQERAGAVTESGAVAAPSATPASAPTGGPAPSATPPTSPGAAAVTPTAPSSPGARVATAPGESAPRTAGPRPESAATGAGTVTSRQAPTASGPPAAPDTAAPSGTPGVSGLSGTSGTLGAAGAAGTPGTSGASGSPGTPGTPRASGTAGISGAPGIPGVSGVSSTPGVSGTAGAPGIPGASSASSTPRVSGTAGAPGIPGASSASGTPGVSGTADVSGAPGTLRSSGVSGASGGPRTPDGARFGAPGGGFRLAGAVGATPSAAQWVTPEPGVVRGPARGAVAASAPAATAPRGPATERGTASASAAASARDSAPAPVGAPASNSATPSPAPLPTSPGAPAPVTPAAPAPAPAPKPGPLPTSPLNPAQAPDPRRIVRGEVGVVALPVAAEVPVATVPVAGVSVEPQPAARPLVRRKNVIGAETTGSIPVHLLFRDQSDPGGGEADTGEDDGGPATVAMSPPTPHAKTKAKGKATIPAPTRPKASRPAPTADPKLVERDGPVLPGWIGVLGGALALTGCAAVLWWTGAVPEQLARMLRLPPRPYQGIHLGQWALLALGVLATLFALGGLGRGRVGYAWVLTLFGDYRGTVRRTGLVWTSPLLLRRRVDVRLRHWRSEPLSCVDAKGTALRVVVLVVWRIRDTVRAALGVEGHEEYLREQVEAAMARVLSQLPADAFHEDAPTLRDAEAVGEALTRMLSAECAPVGIDVFSAQPTRIEYAPEIAAAMQRRRIAAIDAKHRDSVLTSVVDAVDDVVHRLTTRGLVELDDYERKALVKDLTVAFYTGRTGPVEGA